MSLATQITFLRRRRSNQPFSAMWLTVILCLLQLPLAHCWMTLDVHTWPVGKNGHALIEYCYKDHATETKFSQHVEDAIAMWMNALPEDIGVRFVRSTKLCEEHKDDAPRVHIQNHQNATAATAGYHGRDVGQQGRHQLWISDNFGFEYGSTERTYSNEVVDVAHELGHVLGLNHEHQRPDATNYIQFNCSYFPGYQDIKQRVEEKPIRGLNSIDQICADRVYADAYSWDFGTCILKYPHNTTGLKFSENYDIDSIMHYRGWSSEVMSVLPEGLFLPPAEILDTALTAWIVF